MVDSRDAHAGRRPDPLRRRQPGPALERVRQARPGRGREQRRPGRRQPGAQLRVAERDRGEGAVQADRTGRRHRRAGRRQAVRGPLPGPRGAGGRHRRRRPRWAARSAWCRAATSSSCRHRAAVWPGSARSPSRPGRPCPCRWSCCRNLASAAAGATATGDGVNQAKLIDDDEATNWASLNSPVAGKQVTVDLAGGAATGAAACRSAPCCGRRSPATRTRRARTGSPRCGSSRSRPARPGARVTCTDAADFRAVYTSPKDAFPSVAPRPRAPELIFDDLPDPADAGHPPALRGGQQPVHRRTRLRR